MSTEKMQEQFEAWWMGGSYGMRKYDILTEAGVTEDIALEIWQASRESLVIELPKIINKDWACDSSECEFMQAEST